MLTLFVIAGSVTNGLGVLNDNVATIFCVASATEVFILYQVSTDEIVAFMRRMQKMVLEIDYRSIFFNITEEIVTNG